MEYPRILAMTSTSADAPSKESARNVQTVISLTANGNRPQFVPHIRVKAVIDGSTFFRGKDACVIAEYRWLFAEEPYWDLHVNQAIHGYHVQQFEINS
jgi:hypothetical protein